MHPLWRDEGCVRKTVYSIENFVKLFSIDELTKFD